MVRTMERIFGHMIRDNPMICLNEIFIPDKSQMITREMR